MFIKSLRICNTVTGAIMRETSFHKGVNLIVDTESSSRHNIPQAHRCINGGKE